MEEFIVDIKERLFKKAAALIEDFTAQTLKEKDHAIIGVVGGRNVASIFNELSKKDLPWKQMHFFLVDERMVPVLDKESNYLILKENLLDRILPKNPGINKNFHPFDFRKNLSDYEDELKDLGGRFDIIILSSGEDGHIGALYPNHHSIRDDSKYFITMEDSPKPPPKRMSASRELLIRSKFGILLFIGENKREAYDNFIDMNMELEECPAKIVKSIQTSYVLTDLKG